MRKLTLIIKLLITADNGQGWHGHLGVII